MTLVFVVQAGQFLVCGPPEEMRLGLVAVRRRDGSYAAATIVKLLAVVDTADGPRQYGQIKSALPTRRARRRSDPDPAYTFPVTTRRVGDP